MFHPASRLRHHHAEVWLCYDGSIRLAVNAQVIAPDGTDTEMRHGYTHRVSVSHPHWRYLAEALRPAVKAHHEALGLACPDEALPIHLHPRGHPAFDLPPLEDPPPLDHDALRAYLSQVESGGGRSSDPACRVGSGADETAAPRVEDDERSPAP